MAKTPTDKGRLDYRRLKTSRGKFPAREIAFCNSQDGYAEIAFTFADDMLECTHTTFDLETLACSLPAYPLTDQTEILRLIKTTAEASGPLLGLPAPESVSDWMCEIRLAQAALILQRVINGDAAIDSPNMPVVKSSVVDAETGNLVFTSYCLSLVSGIEGSARLETTFPRMPWMKRFTDEESCDYAFVCADASDEQHVIDIHLITFPQDIPTVDYSFMTAYFDGLGHDVSELGVDFEIGDESTLAQPDKTISEEAPLGKSDITHIQHLVHVLIALHTEPVHVDLFKSDGSKDFLAFDTYLSSLWYDFAMRLGSVKVGYCVQCGRGFSLTGHRGMDKEYCSETCRTQAKNERRRTQVSNLRTAFMNGRPVEEIATDVYSDMAPRLAQDAVRKSLRKWPQLKHAVEDDLKNGDGTFTRRCVEEGAVDPEWLERKTHAILQRKRLTHPQRATVS